MLQFSSLPRAGIGIRTGLKNLRKWFHVSSSLIGRSLKLKLPPFLCLLGYDRNGGFCYEIYIKRKTGVRKETFIIISKYIINNASKEFSASSIVEYYNQNNTDTIYSENVYRYLEKLEQACLINRVKRYDIATKRTLKHIEKQFVVDNGFLLACNDSNKIFVAHALENLIYNELLYRGYDVKIGKTYKGEIDFVAMKDGKKCFIQVAYLLSSNDVIEREFGAFDSFRDPSSKYVFSLDEYDMSKDGITHFNIEDWLLNKVDVTLS